MDYKDKITKYLEKGNGMITSQYCREEEIPSVYLTRLVDENVLTRVDRGIYISENGDYDELYFFQYKYKKTIFSYESALYLHGLTDKIPQVIEVSVTSSYKFNDIPHNVEVHYVKNEIAEIGITNVKTIFGNEVRAYNIERIICDCIQNKNKVDPEIYVKTIRDYAYSRTNNINRLFVYAEKMGISEKVRNTMEIIYE